jgi:hypothetical protein
LRAAPARVAGLAAEPWTIERVLAELASSPLKWKSRQLVLAAFLILGPRTVRS